MPKQEKPSSETPLAALRSRGPLLRPTQGPGRTAATGRRGSGDLSRSLDVTAFTRFASVPENLAVNSLALS